MRPRGLLLCIATAFLLATSCGGTEPGNQGTDSQGVAKGFPVTIDAANGDVRISDRPEAIVSISPTATEILFAIGAGQQVVAVDDESDFPSDAPVTDLSGVEPNIEAIAAYEPDLVVFSFDPGRLEKGLDRLGIPTIFQPAATTLEDTYDQIDELGHATGQQEKATLLIQRMQDDIDAIVAGAETGAGLSYYYELDDTYFTATSETFVGSVFDLLGLENIADAADDEGSGYPQLSAEYIVKADPEVIFLADTRCCGQSAETVAARAGWNQISAVQNNAVVELDDDVASRWGPRVVELLRIAAAAVTELAAK